METLNPCAGFLSNFEVLQHLTTQRDQRAKQIKQLSQRKVDRTRALGRKAFSHEEEDDEMARIQPGDLHTVTFECIKYLEDQIHPIRRQSKSSIKKLMEAMKAYDLTKAERLQIVNLAPVSDVELFVCIEDCDTRFPEETRPALLSLIKSHLSPKSKQPNTTNNDKKMNVDEEDDNLYVASDDYEEEMEDAGAMDEDDDEEFVNEGLQGAGDKNEKELDETAD
ncbi:hypothetical protein T439DRAFT_382362 [Meredithblackwellia eburnea MCA 4105]